MLFRSKREKGREKERGRDKERERERKRERKRDRQTDQDEISLQLNMTLLIVVQTLVHMREINQSVTRGEGGTVLVTDRYVCVCGVEVYQFVEVAQHHRLDWNSWDEGPWRGEGVEGEGGQGGESFQCPLSQVGLVNYHPVT